MTLASFKHLVWMGCLVAGLALAPQAQAATITLDSNPSVFYQNTDASPCVIGGNNCKGTLGHTVEQGGGAGTESDVLSPVYALNDIFNVAGGNLFTIGLDYNDTSEDQILREFSMIFCSDATCSGSLGTAQTYTGPISLKTTNNGVGYSDFLLNGFDLGDDNGGATFVQFSATWFNNDGPDRYFIIGGGDGGSDIPPVPEPSSMLLMGGGLLGLAYWRKRKSS